jgi:hypothetical protein
MASDTPECKAKIAPTTSLLLAQVVASLFVPGVEAVAITGVGFGCTTG